MPEIPAPLTLAIACETVCALLRQRAYIDGLALCVFKPEELKALKAADEACARVRERWAYSDDDETPTAEVVLSGQDEAA